MLIQRGENGVLYILRKAVGRIAAGPMRRGQGPHTAQERDGHAGEGGAPKGRPHKAHALSGDVAAMRAMIRFSKA